MWPIYIFLLYFIKYSTVERYINVSLVIICLNQSSIDMVFTITPISFFIVLFLVLSACDRIFATNEPEIETEPVPAVWPEQFHALMLMNKSGSLEIVDLWYDWVNGRNFNIIQKQLGKLTYDLEWNNGTSFYYTLDDSRTCRTVHFEVSLLQLSHHCQLCGI